MASRSVWKGDLKVALITLAVSAYKAVDDESAGTTTRKLHTPCKTPHTLKKWCPTCEKEIEEGDLVKGFEVEKGKFIVISDEKAAALQTQKSPTIPLDNFVSASAIDQIYFGKSYYLAPQSIGGAEAYVILRDSMLGQIAEGVWCTGGKEYRVGIRAKGEGLVMTRLVQHTDIRDIALTPGMEFVRGVIAPPKMVKLAKQLVGSFAGDFEPSTEPSAFKQQFAALIAAEIAGNATATVVETRPTATVIDMMSALERSLEAGAPPKRKKAVVVEPVKAKKGKKVAA